jgi:hypothetical protein
MPFEAIPSRRNALRTALSAILILCVVTVPLCNARCGAQACSVSTSSVTASGCHESSGDDGKTGWKTFVTNRCRAGEIVFTTMRIEEWDGSNNGSSSDVVLYDVLTSMQQAVVVEASRAVPPLFNSHTATFPAVPLRL